MLKYILIIGVCLAVILLISLIYSTIKSRKRQKEYESLHRDYEYIDGRIIIIYRSISTRNIILVSFMHSQFDEKIIKDFVMDFYFLDERILYLVDWQQQLLIKAFDGLDNISIKEYRLSDSTISDKFQTDLISRIGKTLFIHNIKAGEFSIFDGEELYHIPMNSMPTQTIVFDRKKLKKAEEASINNFRAIILFDVDRKVVFLKMHFFRNKESLECYSYNDLFYRKTKAYKEKKAKVYDYKGRERKKDSIFDMRPIKNTITYVEHYDVHEETVGYESTGESIIYLSCNNSQDKHAKLVETFYITDSDEEKKYLRPLLDRIRKID